MSFDETCNRMVKGNDLLPDYIQNACDWSNMRGWKVFPTRPDEKRPYIKDPFGRATNVYEEIIELFSDFPGAGIGVPTGPSNGITVVDVDIKNGVDGWFNLRALDLELPKTGLVMTPSGGFHLYYATGRLEIPCSVSEVASGIDIRGAGGYVQGPGSVTTSGKYLWNTNFISPIGKLANMPSDLLRHCMGAKLEDAYSTGWRRSSVRDELLDPILEGHRNTTLASRIGYLIKKLDDELALQAAHHINETCCKPPLSYRELEGIFRSISNRDQRHG